MNFHQACWVCEVLKNLVGSESKYGKITHLMILPPEELPTISIVDEQLHERLKVAAFALYNGLQVRVIFNEDFLTSLNLQDYLALPDSLAYGS